MHFKVLIRSLCGQGGRGRKKSENFADIISGGSLNSIRSVAPEAERGYNRMNAIAGGGEEGRRLVYRLSEGEVLRY